MMKFTLSDQIIDVFATEDKLTALTSKNICSVRSESYHKSKSPDFNTPLNLGFIVDQDKIYVLKDNVLFYWDSRAKCLTKQPSMSAILTICVGGGTAYYLTTSREIKCLSTRVQHCRIPDTIDLQSNKPIFAASENGEYFCLGVDKKLYLFSKAPCEQPIKLLLLKSTITSLCFSPDGFFIVVGYSDGRVSFFLLQKSLETGNIIDFKRIHGINTTKHAITCCRILQDNRLLVFGTENGDVLMRATTNIYAKIVRYFSGSGSQSSESESSLGRCYSTFYQAPKTLSFDRTFDRAEALIVITLAKKHQEFKTISNEFLSKTPIDLYNKVILLPASLTASLQNRLHNIAPARQQDEPQQSSKRQTKTDDYPTSATPSFYSIGASYYVEHNKNLSQTEEADNQISYTKAAQKFVGHFKQTLLVTACRQCRVEFIEFLLEQRASLYQKNYLRQFLENSEDYKHPPITYLYQALQEKENRTKENLAKLYMLLVKYNSPAEHNKHYYAARGIIAIWLEKSEETIKYLTEAKQPYTNHLLGIAYLFGKSIPQNIHLAMKYLFLACDDNYKPAKNYREKNKDELCYKLVTALVYRSYRYDFHKDKINQELKSYIFKLEPNYFCYDLKKFKKHIKKLETNKHTFFGVDLSDDSDEEEEQRFKQQSAFVSEPIRLYYRGISDRAEFSKLVEQLKSVLYGAIKDIKTTKTLFAPRNRRPEAVTTEEHIQRELDRLNYFNAQGKLNEGIEAISTKFLVAQYRGITYRIDQWNADARREHRKLSEIDQPLFSQACYKKCKVPYNSELTKELKDKLIVAAEAIQAELIRLRKKENYNPATNTKQRYYQSKADYLQQEYTTNYDGFAEKFAELSPELKDLGNPFCSTGDTPLHALKYAYGIKPYKAHRDKRLRPRWNSDLRAERPYSGKIYLSLHPLQDYTGDAAPTHIPSLNTLGRVEIDQLIIQERETSFLGYIPENRIKFTHVAKYPSFNSDYREIHQYKYGLNKEAYQLFRQILKAHAPHTESNKYAKALLGEYLCAFHEVRLIEKAEQLAREQEAILIYRDEYGQFALQPPLNVAPTSGRQPHHVVEQDVLRARRGNFKNKRKSTEQLTPAAVKRRVVPEELNSLEGEFYDSDDEMDC